MVSTPKRGKKAPPKSKPGKWDRAPRTMVAPEPRKKLLRNVGRPPAGEFDGTRRVWRDGEPVHVLKPVRAARRAAIEAAKAAA